MEREIQGEKRGRKTRTHKKILALSVGAKLGEQE
jgi:hypothetical protein